MPYGAFISLSDGLSGLVHISQISQRRIKKPSEVLKVGDRVKVKILNTNNNKISLSMKDAEPEETEEVFDYHENVQLPGRGDHFAWGSFEESEAVILWRISSCRSGST